MQNFKCNVAIMTVITAIALIPAPAHAVADDWKNVVASVCLPYGPGTTFSELTYNQLGVTNPGTTNETVLCPIITDGDAGWSSTPGSAYVFAFYRTGGIPGKVACTLFVSSATSASGPTYSLTSNPPNDPAATRNYLAFPLVDTSVSWSYAPPTVALCTLTPKASLGSFSFHETVITNQL